LAAPPTGLPVFAEIVPGETQDAEVGLAAEALAGSTAPVRTARSTAVSVAQPLAATDADLETNALQSATAASSPEPVVRSVAAAVQSTPTDGLATPAVIAAVLMEQTESVAPAQAAQAQPGAQSLPGSIPAAANTTSPAAAELQAAAGSTASLSGAAGTTSAGNAAVIPADAPPADVVVAPTSGGTARDAGGNASANGEHAYPGAAAGGAAPTAHAISGGDKPAAVRATLAELPAQLNKAARAGLRHLEIALDPASLGRIDVRLDFAADGRLSALFVADTPEALDALRADAQALQRALADAGVDTGSAGFGFSLRQDSGGTGGSPAHHQASLPPSASVGPGGADAAASTAEAQRGSGDPSSPRLDIRA
jgi:flagellar hook-length control protein FliK